MQPNDSLMSDDRVPVPADHAPRKESAQLENGDFVVFEAERSNDAWIQSDLVVVVEE